MSWLAFTLYLALPAFIANMAPVFAAYWNILPALNRPLDGTRTWRTIRLLGDRKTVRGFIVGTLAGGATSALQWTMPAFAATLPYATWEMALAFGIMGGFGALAGDAVKSFVKRRLRIPPAHPFIPFDYLDYIIGFTLCTYPFYAWSAVQVLTLLLFALIANPLTNYLGNSLGIKT